MMEGVGVVSGLFMVVFASLVAKLYWAAGINRFLRGERSPEHWFAHGIVVSFTMVALNALLWKVVIRTVRGMGELEFFFRTAGNLVDLVFMPFVVWAAFCHLYAAWLNLPVIDKPHWNWLNVAFYPRVSVITKLLGGLLNLVQRRK